MTGGGPQRPAPDPAAAAWLFDRLLESQRHDRRDVALRFGLFLILSLASVLASRGGLEEVRLSPPMLETSIRIDWALRLVLFLSSLIALALTALSLLRFQDARREVAYCAGRGEPRAAELLAFLEWSDHGAATGRWPAVIGTGAVLLALLVLLVSAATLVLSFL